VFFFPQTVCLWCFGLFLVFGSKSLRGSNTEPEKLKEITAPGPPPFGFFFLCQTENGPEPQKPNQKKREKNEKILKKKKFAPPVPFPPPFPPREARKKNSKIQGPLI